MYACLSYLTLAEHLIVQGIAGNHGHQHNPEHRHCALIIHVHAALHHLKNIEILASYMHFCVNVRVSSPSTFLSYSSQRMAYPGNTSKSLKKYSKNIRLGHSDLLAVMKSLPFKITFNRRSLSTNGLTRPLLWFFLVCRAEAVFHRQSWWRAQQVVCATADTGWHIAQPKLTMNHVATLRARARGRSCTGRFGDSRD